MRLISKLIGKLLGLCGAVMVIWIILSIINVASNNSSPETIANVWNWNFFTIIIEIGEMLIG